MRNLVTTTDPWKTAAQHEEVSPVYTVDVGKVGKVGIAAF